MLNAVKHLNADRWNAMPPGQRENLFDAVCKFFHCPFGAPPLSLRDMDSAGDVRAGGAPRLRLQAHYFVCRFARLRICSRQESGLSGMLVWKGSLAT